MSNLIYKIKKAILHPELVFFRIFRRTGSELYNRIFLNRQYFLKTGQKLNLKKPLLYNEKIQWLKLYDHKPEYINMVDKYEVRKYITDTIGDEYLFPLYGVWNTFDEIPFDELPDQFVLKCTHDSGGVIICNNKQILDISKTRKYMEYCLARNIYWPYREWAYKNIKPRIIAEKLMVDESGHELKDYKIFCFNGEPKIIQVDFDRFTEHKRNIYSLQWEYQELKMIYPTDPHIIIQKPKQLELMLDLARKLSIGKIHVRVDLYVIDKNIFFGELTFYPEAGYINFYTNEWNRVFGSWINLPNH